MLKNAFGFPSLVAGWKSLIGFVFWALGVGVGVPANEAGLSGNQPPILGKSVTDFWEMRHRFWGNPSPILRKSITDFGGNPLPILGKCVTDFGEKHVPFLGKTGSVFGTNKFGLGKNWFGLGEIGSVFGLAWDKAQVSLL